MVPCSNMTWNRSVTMGDITIVVVFQETCRDIIRICSFLSIKVHKQLCNAQYCEIRLTQLTQLQLTQSTQLTQFHNCKYTKSIICLQS